MLDSFVKEIFRRSRPRYDRQFKMCRIAVQDHYLRKVDRFELDLVNAAVRTPGRDLHLLREHTMFDNRTAVRVQDDLLLQLRLFLLLRLFSRSPGVIELLVDLFQILVFVVER